METMEKKIVIVMLPSGFVIGRWAENYITQPRVLIIAKGEKDNSISIGFKELIGDPDLFSVGYLPYYPIENAELGNLYLESVTGLKIVNE